MALKKLFELAGVDLSHPSVRKLLLKEGIEDRQAEFMSEFDELINQVTDEAQKANFQRLMDEANDSFSQGYETDTEEDDGYDQMENALDEMRDIVLGLKSFLGIK